MITIHFFFFFFSIFIVIMFQIRNAVMARYALLPYWYTLFYEAYKSGNPTMRPLFFEYPQDKETFNMDDQWLVGSDILVKPATSKGMTTTEVYFPGRERERVCVC
jgi:mannosyl-oligosaccharide alpha-1,3-glucosidase